MSNNKIGKYAALSALGLAMLIAGLVLVKTLPDGQGVMLTLPYICVGIGAGIFGGNLGTAVKNYTMKKNPKAARQIEIEEKDERNIAISNRAKAKAYDLMLMVFSALILAFALMQVGLYIILTLVGAYLFVVFAFIYYISKYNKKM